MADDQNPPDNPPPQAAPRKKKVVQDEDMNEEDRETNQEEENEPKLLEKNKPWRKIDGNHPWSEETMDALKKEIATHELTERAGVEHINVLLVGEIGVGKSSFFNSIESIFKGRVTYRAITGSVKKSLTTQYRQYFVCGGKALDNEERNIKFRFCDSMGLEGEDAGLSATDVAKILDGHVKELTQLSSGQFDPGNFGYNANPTENEKIHCLIILMNALTVTGMDPAVKEKIQSIRREANARHLNPIIILTRIDSLCEDTEVKTSDVFHSKAIRDKVAEISNSFGIPENTIHPVRNYKTEIECVTDINILTLRALRQILRNSEDFLTDKIEIERDNPNESELKKSNYKISGSTQVTNKEVSQGPINTLSSALDQEEEKEEEIVTYKNGCETVKNTPGDKGLVGTSSLDNSTNRKWKAKLYSGAPGQISLKEGELVEEVSPSVDGWMTVRNTDGKKGSVPTSHLMLESTVNTKWKAKLYIGAPGQISLAQEEIVEELEPAVNGWMKIKKRNGEEGLAPTSHLAIIATTKWKAKVYFGAPGQMSLTDQEIVEEVKPAVDGWMTVKKINSGEEGLVPTSHLVDPTKPVIKTWFAAHDYDCDMAPDQLNLKNDEELVELVPDTKGWTRVKNKTGKEGLVRTKFLIGQKTSVRKTWLAAEDYDCDDAPDQLSLKKDEELMELVSDKKGWTRVKNKNDEEGLVRTNSLVDPKKPVTKTWLAAQDYDCEEAPEQLSLKKDETLKELVPDKRGWTRVKNKNGEEGLVKTKMLVIQNKSVTETLLAAEDYDCEDAPDQLSMKKGEELTLLIPDKNGWTRVNNKKGEEGLVKTKFLVDPKKQDNKTWLAAQDYDCEGAPDQLSLRNEEKLEELLPDKKGWTRVKNENGKEGLVKTKFLVGPKKPTIKKWLAAQAHDCEDAPDQMSLEKNETLQELVPDKNGWTRVKNKDGQEGLIRTYFLVDLNKRLEVRNMDGTGAPNLQNALGTAKE